MSKLQHTPGPWNEEGIYTILRYADKHDMDIDESEKIMPWSTDDARLIAAAPEMLDALIMVKKYGHSGYVEGSKSDIEFWFKIDRTIEKATGMLKAREE